MANVIDVLKVDDTVFFTVYGQGVQGVVTKVDRELGEFDVTGNRWGKAHQVTSIRKSSGLRYSAFNGIAVKSS